MKKKILLSLDEDVAKQLEKQSKELGITKSNYITQLIKENTENRLSKHIARDIENLVLYLLLNQENLKPINNENLMEKLDFIFNQGKIIKSSKSILLREEKKRKKQELKNFWNKILKMLEPNNFYKSIGYQNGKINFNKLKSFITELHKIIKENKKLWE
jgi:hypothetical protein